MKKIKILSLAATCAVLVNSPLAAQQTTTVTGPRSDEYLIERVSYNDLNLAVASDENRLNQRVRRAVTRVCPDHERSAVSNLSGCRSGAFKVAEPQIALAVQRARQIATSGFSSIAPVAITISAR